MKSRIIVAAINVLELQSKNSQPTIFQIPKDLLNYSKLEKQKILHEAAGMVVDAFVFDKENISEAIDRVITAQEKTEISRSQDLNVDGRFPCRFEGCKKSFKYDGKSRKKHELSHQPLPVVPELPCPTSLIPSTSNRSGEMHTDDIFNYNCAVMTDGLLFLNFLDATSEGDGLRILRQYKYVLLYFKADRKHSTKYALECLYQFFMAFALLSPRDSERFTWNRTVNNAGGHGKNIALDLNVEHSNNYVKQAIKNVGPNLTDHAVNRICHAEQGVKRLTTDMDKSIERISGSGKHSCCSTKQDLDELLKRLVATNVFAEDRNRRFTHYSNFERDPLKNLDHSKLYKWINIHKDNVHAGIKAR